MARNADTLPGGRSTNHDEHDVRAALPRPQGAGEVMRGKRSRGHAIIAPAAI